MFTNMCLPTVWYPNYLNEPLVTKGCTKLLWVRGVLSWTTVSRPRPRRKQSIRYSMTWRRPRGTPLGLLRPAIMSGVSPQQVLSMRE